MDGLYIEVGRRGAYYVTPDGYIIRTDGMGRGSRNWVFLGISSHHWHRRITVPFIAILDDPQLALRGYVWDSDHGTVRRWGGARVTRCVRAMIPTALLIDAGFRQI